MIRLGDLFRRAPPPAPIGRPALPAETPRPAPTPFRLPDPAEGDPLLAAALTWVPGRRCLLTGDDPLRLTRAWLAMLQSGAASALIATSDPPRHAEGLLRDEALRWGLGALAAPWLARPPAGARVPHTPYLDCDRPADWWMRGTPEEDDCAARAGPLDLLVDFRPWGANPDPLARLTALAAMGAPVLVLEAGDAAETWLEGLGFGARGRQDTVLVARRR